MEIKNVNKGNNNSYDVVSQHVNIKGNIYKTYELEIEERRKRNEKSI